MAKKKINIQSLVNKIDGITRQRLAESEVVSLSDFRALKGKKSAATILVIDDDETLRMVLKRILEEEGYRVLVGADGTQLEDVIGDAAPDLIILDVGLPWINGFELARLLKEHPDLKNIPLIFVSGQTSQEDVRLGFEAGADDYIKKPFDIETIKKAVRVLLKVD